MANYLKINKQAIADGPGVRVSIYLSGCRNGCPGCHTKESWDFAKGTEFTNATVTEILKLLSFEYISGLTICGGEPMEPENQIAVSCLVNKVKEIYPEKTIWCYTGYEWKDLQLGGKKYTDFTTDILKRLDVLITGRFELDKRNITKDNLWRGSTNQRVVDVQESLKQGKQINLANIPNNENGL